MENNFQQIKEPPSTGFTPASSPSSGFTPATPPKSGSLFNKILVVILIVLVPAGLVVGFLLLRNRGIVGSKQVTDEQSDVVQPPPDTRPLESYTPEPAWQEGDSPIPQDKTGGGLESEDEI